MARLQTAGRDRAAGGPGGAAGTAVEVASLSKRYGAVEAVKGVSFSVGRGEVFAFLGPNGAGKTTTVRMLCTLTRPGGGRASVAGFRVRRGENAACIGITCVFAAVFLALAVVGFGQPD